MKRNNIQVSYVTYLLSTAVFAIATAVCFCITRSLERVEDGAASIVAMIAFLTLTGISMMGAANALKRAHEIDWRDR